MNVVAVETPAARSRICESVLRELPEWFGIEEATAAYIHDVSELPMFAVGGFAPLEALPTLWGENNPCLIMVMRL